ncbi:MAG: hypothetical protein DRJ35_06600 [Thermoprotei archaeon]|nr:MAG: hypothetical protein DRJ35_06600 [Thermoprotei archaeon]
MRKNKWDINKIRKIVERSFVLNSPALIEFIRQHFIVEPNIHFSRLGLLRVIVISFREALKSQYTIRLVKGRYDGVRIYMSFNLMPATYVKLLPLAMTKSTIRMFVGFLQTPISKNGIFKEKLGLNTKIILSKIFTQPIYRRTPKGKVGLKYLELAYVKLMDPFADYKRACVLFRDLMDRRPLFSKRDFYYFEKYYWLGNIVTPVHLLEKNMYIYIEGPDALKVALIVSNNPSTHFSWIGENEVFIAGHGTAFLNLEKLKTYIEKFRISLPIRPIEGSEMKAFLTPFFEYYDGKKWETPHIRVE